MCEEFDEIKVKKIFSNIKTVLQCSHKSGSVLFVAHQINYTFPLAYAYLSAYLIEKNVPVKIFFKKKSPKELAKEILNIKPMIVAFGSLYPELEEIREIIYYLNALGRDFPIIIGGQMVSPIPEFACKVTGADIGVIGEGEYILYKVYEAIKNDTSLYKIKGLCIRENEITTLTGNVEDIVDIDNLPAIDYSLFPTKEWLSIGAWYTAHYPQQPHWRIGDRVVNVHGGRGCPYTCNFCYHHNYPRYRNISIMLDEARILIDRFNANVLYFSDDLVLATPQRALALCDGIQSLRDSFGKQLEYSISTRFDILKQCNDSLLQRMHDSGCRIMGLGIESGSNRILKIIGKNTTREDILYQLSRLKNAMILPTVSIMFGQFTETKDDAFSSIELMQEAVAENPHINFAFTITTPFPGSKLYKHIMDNKLLENDEEFYRRYFFDTNSTWNQIVNLSAMTKDEVQEMFNLASDIYRNTKISHYSPKQLYKLRTIFIKQKNLAKLLIDTHDQEIIQQLVSELKDLEISKFSIWNSVSPLSYDNIF